MQHIKRLYAKNDQMGFQRLELLTDMPFLFQAWAFMASVSVQIFCTEAAARPSVYLHIPCSHLSTAICFGGHTER